MVCSSAVRYQLKFAYHDTAHLVLRYTLGIEYIKTVKLEQEICTTSMFIATDLAICCLVV